LHAIVGAGSIGLALGARLARAGHSVRFVVRSENAARAIRDQGVTVEDPASGESWRARADACTELPAGEAGVVLLCVRTPDTGAAAGALARSAPHATLVNVQNGVEGDAIAARHFRRVLGAVIRHPCMRLAPNRVRALGAGRIAIGAHPSGGGSDVDAIAAALRGAGYDVGVSQRIGDDRWLKLCFNLMSTPNALVRPAEHATRAFTEGKARLLEEARDALAAAGTAARSCDGRDRSLDQEIAFQRSALERGEAARALPIYNSLWVALSSGAPLEADAYHRAIIALGARHGVATPTNERVLRGLERALREQLGPESFAAAELLGH
jgi:2-dehydropantoate 2-reductase